MLVFKKTHGVVTQVYDENGVCIKQTFWGDDFVEYDNEDGISITNKDELLEDCYFPFDMVQPENHKCN